VVLRIKGIIREHGSLFVLGIASVSFFLLNILLKDIFSPQEYGLYSIFITYCSLISSFGLFGLDQVFLRTSIIDENKIVVDSRLISMVLITVIGMSLIASAIISKYYDFEISYFSLILLSIFMILIKLSYNVSRLLSKFILSQLTLNLWKFSLPFIVVSSIYLGFEVDFSLIIKSLFYCCLFSLSSYFLFYSNIKFKILEYSKKDLMRLSFSFFMVLFISSIINFSDRFIIESKFGLEQIGNYFFYVNLYLYPFVFFSTYIGFRELVSFKKSFSMKLLNQKLINAFKLSILFLIGYFIFTIIIQRLDIYNFQIFEYKYLIILFLIWGVMKVLASLLSATVSAVFDEKDLFKLNKYSIIIILLACPFLYFCISILNVVILYVLVWIIRAFIYYIILLNKQKEIQ